MGCRLQGPENQVSTGHSQSKGIPGTWKRGVGGIGYSSSQGVQGPRAFHERGSHPSDAPWIVETSDPQGRGTGPLDAWMARSSLPGVTHEPSGDAEARMDRLTEAQTPMNGHRASKDAVELGTSHQGPETWDVGLRERQAVGFRLLRTLMNGIQATREENAGTGGCPLPNALKGGVRRHLEDGGWTAQRPWKLGGRVPVRFTAGVLVTVVIRGVGYRLPRYSENRGPGPYNGAMGSWGPRLHGERVQTAARPRGWGASGLDSEQRKAGNPELRVMGAWPHLFR